MAGVLRSLLAPALKKLAAKGENIPFDSLENRLKREGVSASELNTFGDAIQTEANKSETFLLQPDITTTTKKGNAAFTPKGLEKIQELQPTFKTIEETQYDRDQLDFERLDTQTDSDLANERILGQLNELQRKREELITRGLEGGENLDPDELNKIELEADMLLEEIQELDNIYGQNILREEEPPEYKFQEFYKDITPADVNDDTYGMLVVRDPRDTITGDSAHFDYLGRDNYSYHMRYDTETEEEALRVFEMQRDLLKDKWNSFDYKEAASPSILDPAKFSPESVKIIQDQIDKIDGLPTNPDVPEENFSNIKRKELEELNNLWDELTGSEIIELDSYQNLINRSLVKADNEGLNKVKFLINPKGRTARRVARSGAIQSHYSTVVANQIRKTAKKIGSSAIMDKKGYLVVALPAAGFTLPLYGEENKEASFIATAASKGLNVDKAKEMVENRKNFNTGGKVLKSIKKNYKFENRSDFKYATGGRVLRSLVRTSKAEGGILGAIESGIKKSAKFLGFDDEKQLRISADATDLTKQIDPNREVTWVHQGKPITTDQLRNLKSNRDQIGLSGNEELFDTVNHSLFGYETGSNPVAAVGGQLKELYQGTKEVLQGRDWRTQAKDAYNNQFGIIQRSKGLSRTEFDMELAKAVQRTQDKLQRGERLIFGRDVILNPYDIMRKEER